MYQNNSWTMFIWDEKWIKTYGSPKNIKKIQPNNLHYTNIYHLGLASMHQVEDTLGSIYNMVRLKKYSNKGIIISSNTSKIPHQNNPQVSKSIQ